MYNEKTSWFNQQILFHNDKVYGSESFLDISLSSNTNDFVNYSSPKINISIISSLDNSRRLCNLTVQDSIDLLKSIKIATKDIDIAYINKHVIVKRYNQNKDFIIQFKKSRTGDHCVIFRIFFNDSDFGLVIIPLLIFDTFVLLVKQFIDNYISIINQFNTVSILKENYKILQQINNGIKILPSSISPSEIHQQNNTEKPYSENSDSIIQELDNFIGGSEMSKVDIDIEVQREIKKQNIESDKVENNKVEALFDTTFFIDFLKGDILVLEDVLNSILQNENPCFSFLEIQNRNIPNLTDNEIKSISYIPRVIFLTTLRKFIEHNITIPNSNPVLKFKIKEIKEINKDGNEIKKLIITKKEIDFSLDLLLIQSYLKILKTKLESKNSNQNENKSIINLAFRNFTDPFIFSYLETMKCESTKTLVLERFKYLNSIDFFKKYDILLKDLKLSEITNNDISNYIDNIFNKVVGKTLFIEDLQNDLFNKNSLKLPFINDYSSEQIINKITPIEISKNVNNNINDENDVLMKLNINISDKISKLFFNKDEDKKIAKSIKKISDKLNIEKLVDEYINEVPEEWKISLTKYLHTLKNEKFDFSKFPVIEFGDNIVKSLYHWNPVEEESDLINYISYKNKVKNSLMSKSDILHLIKKDSEPEESEEIWNSISFE